MRTWLGVLLSLMIVNSAQAALTVGYIPKARSGGTTPSLQDSIVTESSSKIGIGTATPGYKLEVNGTGHFSGALDASNLSGTNTGDQTTISGNAATATALAANGSNCSAGYFPLGVNASGNSESCTGPIYSLAAWTDPISDYNCSGSATTTTGSGSASSTTLTIASATGWSNGMGIAISNGGSGGNTVHYTTVSNISGTTVTLTNALVSTVVAQTVRHDDTTCLQSAIDSGKNVHVRAGIYNVHGTTVALTLSGTVIFEGDGDLNILDQDNAQNYGTVIVNYSETNDVIRVTGNSNRLRNFSIQQASTVTHTAGYGIYQFNASTRIVDNTFNHITVFRTMGCFKVGQFVATSDYQHFYCASRGVNASTNAAIVYENTTPYGDVNFSHGFVVLPALGIGILILDAELVNFTDVKVNNGDSDLLIENTGNTVIQDIKFVNCSFEGAGGFDPLIHLIGHGTNMHNITFVGNEIGVGSEPFAIYAEGTGVAGLTIVGNLFHSIPAGIGVTQDGVGTTIVGNVFEFVTTAITVGNATDVSIIGNAYTNVTTKYSLSGTNPNLNMFDYAGLLKGSPATQTIAGGNTVAADACGGMKRISSAGAVTTSTSNTFTAPAAVNDGCMMDVCNVGANNITLDNNSNFKSAGGADVVVTPDDCLRVGSNGSTWYQVTALEAN